MNKLISYHKKYGHLSSAPNQGEVLKGLAKALSNNQPEFPKKATDSQRIPVVCVATGRHLEMPLSQEGQGKSLRDYHEKINPY